MVQSIFEWYNIYINFTNFLYIYSCSKQKKKKKLKTTQLLWFNSSEIYFLLFAFVFYLWIVRTRAVVHCWIKLKKNKNKIKLRRINEKKLSIKNKRNKIILFEKQLWGKLGLLKNNNITSLIRAKKK